MEIENNDMKMSSIEHSKNSNKINKNFYRQKSFESLFDSSVLSVEFTEPNNKRKSNKNIFNERENQKRSSEKTIITKNYRKIKTVTSIRSVNKNIVNFNLNLGGRETYEFCSRCHTMSKNTLKPLGCCHYLCIKCFKLQIEHSIKEEDHNLLKCNICNENIPMHIVIQNATEDQANFYKKHNYNNHNNHNFNNPNNNNNFNFNNILDNFNKSKTNNNIINKSKKKLNFLDDDIILNKQSKKMEDISNNSHNSQNLMLGKQRKDSNLFKFIQNSPGCRICGKDRCLHSNNNYSTNKVTIYNAKDNSCNKVNLFQNKNSFISLNKKCPECDNVFILESNNLKIYCPKCNNVICNYCNIIADKFHFYNLKKRCFMLENTKMHSIFLRNSCLSFLRRLIIFLFILPLFIIFFSFIMARMFDVYYLEDIVENKIMKNVYLRYEKEGKFIQHLTLKIPKYFVYVASIYLIPFNCFFVLFLLILFVPFCFILLGNYTWKKINY
jgi:hypothetical protein